MQKRILWLTILFAVWLMAIPTVYAQAEVRIVVNRDNVNIRLTPALGAEVIGTANAGTPFTAYGRSPDSEWLQVQFAGGEGWIGVVVVTVLEGDINGLPIRDPRVIPYGGNEAPRAGFTDQTSDIRGRLPNTGVRLRSGPGVAYKILANPLRFSEFYLLGRSPDNVWLQVNYDGTLGWMMTRYVEILDERNLLELPVDGVVASALPLNISAENEMFGMLRYMRERIDLAQPSLDQQRLVWTDAALGVVPFCGGYPAKPSNLNVPGDIYAQYYATLDPLVRDFNAAMLSIRTSIDLQQEVCNRAGANTALISPPVVTGGLEAVNDADAKFASLRRRIDELLPVLGPEDCVFAFSGRVDVLPLYPAYDQIVAGEFSDATRTIGYCFDASPISVGYVEMLLAENGNYDVVIAISPIDDPTNFIATGAGGENSQETNIIVPNINFPFEGRYLLLVQADSGQDDVPPIGRYALLLADTSGAQPLGNALAFDENGDAVRNDVPLQLADGTIQGNEVVGQTGSAATATNNTDVAVNVYVSPDVASGIIGQIAPAQTVTAIGTITGWVQVQLASGQLGWAQDTEVTFTAGQQAVTTQAQDSGTGQQSGFAGSVFCPGVTLTCDELFTCQEVQACVDAGSIVLDPNGNGIACDATEGNSPLSCSVQSR